MKEICDDTLEKAADFWSDIAYRALQRVREYESLTLPNNNAPKDDSRSVPGQEEQVAIYCVGPVGGETEMYCGFGPDYAVCHWPIIVKAKRDVTPEQLAQLLKDLAKSVEEGLAPVEPDVIPLDSDLPF